MKCKLYSQRLHLSQAIENSERKHLQLIEDEVPGETQQRSKEMRGILDDVSIMTSSLRTNKIVPVKYIA